MSKSMPQPSPRIGLFTTFGLLLAGCYGTPSDAEPVSQAEQAVNVCGAASIAANLIVDGIPAYAQCTASSNAAIYSNNGVDTATTATSSDWKRTQFSGGYQCTELVHRYWLFKWNITWLPNGDAGTWCSSTPPSSSGIVQTTTPVHGDAIVFLPGSCGADTTYGHVALVDTVDTAGSKVTYVEQNNAGRRTGAFSCAACFLHVVANNGSAGATGTGGTASATGGAMSTGGASVASGGRTNAGGGTATTAGGNPTSTGGSATSTGGRATSGGSATTATGGSSAVSSGGSLASGGSNSNSLGGQTTSTGGVAPTGGVTNGNGGANAAATGGTTTTNTTVVLSGGTAVGGTAVGGDATVGAAGQGITSGDGIADPDSGCSCRMPHSNSSNRTLGFVGLAIAMLLRSRRKRHDAP